MNLLDLFVKIAVKDESSAGMEKATANAIAKGQVMANAITSAIQSAVNAINGFLQDAIGSYAQYEQQVGGMQTFFGDSADTVISNAKRAYETAGMSANEYMSNVSSFAMSLISSVSKERAGALQQDTTAQQAALDQQVENAQAAYAAEYSARQKAMAREYQAYSDQLQDEQEALSEQLSERLDSIREELQDELKEYSKRLDRRVEAQEEANARELDDRRETLSREYDELKSSLDKEVDAFKSATDERIRQVNKEYTERLKLIDEDKYNRIKAIEDEIDALNGQTDAERAANKRQQQASKEAALIAKTQSAVTVEEREKAAADLADLQAQIAQDEREADRKNQISKLKDEKSRIQEEADQRKAALKQSTDDYIEAYREQRAGLLKEQQETNRQRLESTKKANDAEIAAMSKMHSDQISQMREENKTELEERSKQNERRIKDEQKANAAILKEAQRSNRDMLQDFKDGQDAQLDAMKSSQDAQLKSLKASVAAQKKELADAANANGEFIETTAEDQAKAAEIADMAMKDMSDNANKMGTDIGMIQNAYQGFAKQNFTMLDNLKLGFGGTKSEMERLLETAEQIKAKNGEVVDYSIDSFADIVQAIHTVQEEMGITGTTATEGATTIEGAVNRVKGAWDNWLVSLADPEWDVGQATTDLVNSVGDAAELIIPRVSTILSSLFTVIQERGPEIWDQFKQAIMDSIPDEWKDKVQAAMEAIGGFFEALSGLMTFIAENHETIANLAIAFGALSVISQIVGFVANLISIFGPFIASAGGVEGVLGAIGAALTGPVGITVALVAAGIAIGTFIATNEDAQRAIQDIWDAIVGFFKGIPGTIGGFFDDLGRSITDTWDGVVNNTTQFFKNLGDGASNGFKAFSEWIQSIPDAIMNAFSNAGDWLVNAGKNVMTGFQNGLISVWNDIAGWVQDIGSWIQNNKGPESYDKKLLVRNGQWIMGGLHEGLEREFEHGIMPYVSGMADAMEGAFGNPVLSPLGRAMTASATGNARGAAQQPTTVNAVLELDRVAFGRLVFQLNGEETQRVGVQLAGGYA